MTIALLLFVGEGVIHLYEKFSVALAHHQYEKCERERERAAAAAQIRVETVPEDPRIIRARQLRENLGAALSTGEPVVADVAALPKDRQTIRLKFTAFKAKVCRRYTQ